MAFIKMIITFGTHKWTHADLTLPCQFFVQILWIGSIKPNSKMQGEGWTNWKQKNSLHYDTCKLHISKSSTVFMKLFHILKQEKLPERGGSTAPRLTIHSFIN